MNRSSLIRLGLCPWVLLLPVLAMHSSPGPDDVGFGLSIARNCTMSVGEARACVRSCSAPISVPEELPDEMPLTVQCTLRLPVPQIGPYLTAPDEEPPALEFVWIESEPAPSPIDQADRPLVPPPQPRILS